MNKDKWIIPKFKEVKNIKRETHKSSKPRLNYVLWENYGKYFSSDHVWKNQTTLCCACTTQTLGEGQLRHSITAISDLHKRKSVSEIVESVALLCQTDKECGAVRYCNRAHNESINVIGLRKEMAANIITLQDKNVKCIFLMLIHSQQALANFFFFWSTKTFFFLMAVIWRGFKSFT